MHLGNLDLATGNIYINRLVMYTLLQLGGCGLMNRRGWRLRTGASLKINKIINVIATCRNIKKMRPTGTFYHSHCSVFEIVHDNYTKNDFHEILGE